jgi:hypothetical protein
MYAHTHKHEGMAPALMQGPMSRFGDTASNAGTLALLDSYETTRNVCCVHMCGCVWAWVLFTSHS